MLKGMNVISLKSKGKMQAVQGVIVHQEKGKFVFNYNTLKDPRPSDIEFLRQFRNRFVDELEKLNAVLQHLPD